MSRPTDERAVIDGGFKTFDFDQTEYPRLKEESLGAKLVSFSEEHGVLRLESEKAKEEIRIGNKLEFVPYHVCTCVNQHNNLYLTNKVTLEKFVLVFSRDLVYGM